MFIFGISTKFLRHFIFLARNIMESFINSQKCLHVFYLMNWYLMTICVLLVIETTTSESLAVGTETTGMASVYRSAEQIQALIDNGQFECAQKLLDQDLFRPYNADSLPLLHARAYLYQHKRDFVSEAATYHDILLLVPSDRAALRGRVFAVLNMGAPHLSITYAKQNPEVFSSAELRSLQQASAGRSIKWGEIEGNAGIGPKRFKATDKALEQNANVRAAHVHDSAIDSSSGHLTEFDRIVGLCNRVRMNEAIALYENLKKRHIQIPPYALAAVADAYSHQHQPKQACNLYLEALALSRSDREYPNREWQMNLFYAYIDANEFDAARKLIDQVEKEIPPVLNKGLRGVEVDNDLYEQARVNVARARLYADKLNESQTLLEQTLLTAPFSLDARLAYADLLQSRDQPRAAQKQYASLLVDDPTNTYAAVGIAETALTLQDLDTAKTQFDTLTRNYPENLGVQYLQRRLQAYQQPVLTVSSAWGHSSTGGGNNGNQSWLIDEMLHTATFYNHWRVFEHSFNAEATFGNTTGTRHRIGIGTDYRSPAWLISGELNQDLDGLDNVGANLSTSWLPSDQWRLDTGIESNSNDIPLKASAAGITKQALDLGMSYNHQEFRNLSTNLDYSWFSDSNHRIEAGANWMERWWSGSTYKLDTRLGVFASNSTLDNAVYFNPRNDASIDAQMINEWTLWRNYLHSFKHRLVFGVGQYWQQDYGAKATDNVRYEHEWNFDPFRALSYGVGFERHPYDGVIDTRISASLSLTWHF